MEKVLLAELSRLFVPSKNRYDSPRHEALQLRALWTGRKIMQAETDSEEATKLYKIITEKLENGAELSSIFHLIRKGLMLDPKLHFFYGLKGDFHCQKNNWKQAIQNYQLARIFSKGRPGQENTYTNKLIQAYCQRGSDYEKSQDFFKALGDYEQVLILKPEDSVAFIVQDKILSILRLMERYIAFRFHLTEFMKFVDSKRTSKLLTQHAEYKIHLREMSVARHILYEAIELDKKNTKAQELLQTIFLIGHSMVAHAIIWCSYGCYDKALLTIEKGRDCDPYNPGYTLLKAIVLRLSGRLNEAAKWLRSVDKGFYKLLDPSKDMHGSIMGNLTIEETKLQLVQQWHLIRYDHGVELMIQDRHKEAIIVLSGKSLLQMFPETHTLLGDCYLKLKMPILALQYYIKSFEKYQAMKTLKPKSKKYLHLMQRLENIIYSDIFKFSPTQEMSNLTKKVLQIFKEEQIDLNRISQ